MRNLKCQMSNSSLGSRNDNIVATRIHLKLFQGPRRGTADILTAQVVLPVVTGAPNLLGVFFVLDDAFQVGTHGRERFEFSAGCVHQDARLVSEFEDLSRVQAGLRSILPRRLNSQPTRQSEAAT
jgi:hypothetical protein